MDILECNFIRRDFVYEPLYNPDPCWHRLWWRSKPQIKDTFPGEDCYAVAVAEIESKYVYVSAAKGHPNGWHIFGRNPYNTTGFDEFGTPKQFRIDEMECLIAATMGITLPGGFWVGGEKYNMTSFTKSTVEVGFKEELITLVFANRPGKGVYMAVLEGKIVVCLYEGHPDWHGGACQHYLLEFCKLVLEQGVFHGPWSDADENKTVKSPNVHKVVQSLGDEGGVMTERNQREGGQDV